MPALLLVLLLAVVLGLLCALRPRRRRLDPPVAASVPSYTLPARRPFGLEDLRPRPA